jgi:hypothetical protein
MPVILFGGEMNARTQTMRAGRGFAAGAVFFAMLLGAFSFWTVIPLTWVWIASKVSHTQFPSGGPYLVVIVGILVSVAIDSWLIGRLNSLYIRVTGTNRVAAARPAWMRSMRDQTPTFGTLTVVEAVMICSVLLAAVALTLWFFFLSGSPIPDQ